MVFPSPAVAPGYGISNGSTERPATDGLIPVIKVPKIEVNATSDWFTSFPDTAPKL